MEKIPEKFNPFGEKFIEAIHRKKAETKPGYEEENPATAEEVIDDLKKMGTVKEEVEIKKEKEKEKEERLEKMAEFAVESAFGKGVFREEISEKKEITKERKPKYKPYPQSEIERIGNLLADYTKKFREARTKGAKEVYQEKIKNLRGELEKAKAVRDKNKRKIEEQKEKEIRPQLQVDIGESQPKTYSEKVYSRENFPEDHAKF